MSWKAKARRTYEARVVSDTLARLAERRDLKGLPFSGEELKTLAERSRESFRNPKRGNERLARCEAQLAKAYGAEMVADISAELESINNEIGYEEK